MTLALILSQVGALPGWGQAQAPAKRSQAAQAKAPSKPDRKTAMALADAHRDLEALPILEELAKVNPGDRVVQERLATCLVTKAATVKPEESGKILLRARSILHELRKTGPLSDLGEVLADGLPADGKFPTFSKRSEAQTAMREGEAAFAGATSTRRGGPTRRHSRSTRASTTPRCSSATRISPRGG